MRKLGFVFWVGTLTMIACHQSEPPPPLALSATATPPASGSVAPLATAPIAAADAGAVDPSLKLAAPAAAAPPAAAPGSVAKLPTPTDYEASAESTITPSNAAAVLAAIDKQVGP